MFIDIDLPTCLWGEAIRTAAYQINRSPAKALESKIPAELYLREYDLSKLKVFTCKSWVLKLPKENKLEPRAVEMRMVGFAGSGYRLWNPITNEIVISRNVTFDELDYYLYRNKHLWKTTVYFD